MRISEAFDMFETNMRLKNYNPGTIRKGRYVKNSMVAHLGDIDVANLTVDDVFSWVESNRFYIGKGTGGKTQKKANNTLLGYIQMLRSVLKYASINGVPCLNHELIPLPKREAVCRTFLNASEVKEMIDCAEQIRDKLIISLFFSSGIRLAELVSLDRDSIHDGKFTVVGKGKKTRLCFVDDRTEGLLSKYLKTRTDKCPALFVSKIYQSRLGKTMVDKTVRVAAQNAGIKKTVSPHILRHSFATNFIHNNGDIRTLSILMGHASVSTTAIYTHIVDNRLEEQYKRFHSI